MLAAKKPGGVGSGDGTVRVSKQICNGSKWCFLTLCNDDAFSETYKSRLDFDVREKDSTYMTLPVKDLGC